MIDLDLIKNILVVAIASSIISTAVIQKIKEILTAKKWLFLVSLIVSLGTGFLFSICFSNLGQNNAIWVGICTWVGADLLYKSFEDKIFKSFSNMNNKKEDDIVGEIPND